MIASKRYLHKCPGCPRRHDCRLITQREGKVYIGTDHYVHCRYTDRAYLVRRSYR